MPTRKTTAAPASKAAAKKTTTKKAAPTKASARASSPARQSLVIYVHGVGVQPAPDVLKLQWDLALFGKDLGDRSRMAYWADVLHGAPSTAAAKKAAARRAAAEAAAEEAAQPDDPTGIDIAHLLARAGVAPGQADAEAFAQHLLQVLGAPPQPLVIGPGKKLMPLPPALRRPLSKAFLEAFVADTAAYFFRQDARQKIRQRLATALKAAAGQPVTLVAHSHGSIVAYEVLSALGEAAGKVGALVTIGSPLGIAEVQDWLEPDTREVPAGLARWHNFADPLDPVAMDKRLAGDFKPASKIQDELIVNSHSRRIEGFNPHSAVGYLAHPSVRRAVHAAMRMDVMAPFVLARDVAERLDAAPDQRHPVLVEVLEPGWPALGESAPDMQAQERKERSALAVGNDDWMARWPSFDPEAPLQLEHRVARTAALLESWSATRKPPASTHCAASSPRTSRPTNCSAWRRSIASCACTPCGKARARRS